jgi:hypothetical protein
LPPGIVEASGMISVGADRRGEVTIWPSADGTPIAGPETREGTTEECAAMRADALASLQDLQAQVAANGVGTGAGTVINVSGGAGVSTEP